VRLVVALGGTKDLERMVNGDRVEHRTRGVNGIHASGPVRDRPVISLLRRGGTGRRAPGPVVHRNRGVSVRTVVGEVVWGVSAGGGFALVLWLLHQC